MKAPSKAVLKKLVSALYFVGISYFLYLFFRSIDVAELRDLKINIPVYLSSIFFMVFARFLFPLIWKFLLGEFNLYLKDMTFIYYVYAKSWLGKYIPGNIMTITGKVVFASERGYDRKTLGIVSFLESYLQALTSLVTGLIIVGLLNNGIIDNRVALVSLVAGVFMITFIVPAVFNKAISRIYLLLKKKTLDEQYYLRFSTVFRSMALFSILSIIPGLALSILAYSLYPEFNILDSLLYIVGSLNLAGALGLIAVFAPGGLGIKDGILALLLAPLFPKELLLVFIILARVTTVLADLIFFGITWIAKSLRM